MLFRDSSLAFIVISSSSWSTVSSSCSRTGKVASTSASTTMYVKNAGWPFVSSGLLVDRDQVARADVKVMLKRGDCAIVPFGGEDDHEVVVGIIVDLRPLVLVADVLDGQRVELEGLLQQPVVIIVGGFDVEPEAFGRAHGEGTRHMRVVCRQAASVGGDQRPHAFAA